MLFLFFNGKHREWLTIRHETQIIILSIYHITWKKCIPTLETNTTLYIFFYIDIRMIGNNPNHSIEANTSKPIWNSWSVLHVIEMPCCCYWMACTSRTHTRLQKRELVPLVPTDVMQKSRCLLTAHWVVPRY